MARRTISFIALLATAWFCGCSGQSLPQGNEGNAIWSPQQRYRILSFFFDGVPDPTKKNLEEGSGGEGKNAKTSMRASYHEHGPFAAKLCDSCHESTGSNKLILPIEELCINCHQLNIKKRLVHGPLATGNCRTCHDPHGSSYRYLLVTESKTFCYFCHNSEDILKREVHQKNNTEECTACHDAHASDKDFLLK